MRFLGLCRARPRRRHSRKLSFYTKTAVFLSHSRHLSRSCYGAQPSQPPALRPQIQVFSIFQFFLSRASHRAGEQETVEQWIYRDNRDSAPRAQAGGTGVPPVLVPAHRRSPVPLLYFLAGRPSPLTGGLRFSCSTALLSRRPPVPAAIRAARRVPKPSPTRLAHRDTPPHRGHADPLPTPGPPICQPIISDANSPVLLRIARRVGSITLPPT